MDDFGPFSSISHPRLFVGSGEVRHQFWRQWLADEARVVNGACDD